MKFSRFETFKVLILYLVTMQSFKFTIVLFAALVIVYGAPEYEKNMKVFKECAETNGFKVSQEVLEQALEHFKKDDDKLLTQSQPSEEFLCAQRCFHEKMGLIEEGKFNIEKVKADEIMMLHIPADKIESYLECLKEIEVTECADLQKSFACRYR